MYMCAHACVREGQTLSTFVNFQELGSDPNEQNLPTPRIKHKSDHNITWYC